jgi:hypothetical protein
MAHLLLNNNQAGLFRKKTEHLERHGHEVVARPHLERFDARRPDVVVGSSSPGQGRCHLARGLRHGRSTLGLRPLLWQQLRQPFGRMTRQPPQHVTEVTPRLDAQRLAGLREGVQHRRRFAPYVTPNKQIVLAFMRSSA